MPKLINLGSLCIDHVYAVANLVGSGETVSSTSHEIYPGGKGLNQSLASVYAGAEVAHFGCVGDDGQFLVDLLAGAGVDVEGIRQVKGETSGHAVIQVNADGENAIVIAGGTNRLLERSDFERAFSQLGHGDWLLLQNEINDIDVILEMAAQSGAQVAFNIAPVDGRESRYDLAAVALLIVNQIEGAAVVGSESEPELILAALAERWPDMTSVLTLGADGLLAYEHGRHIHLTAHAVKTVDETAAGDAFIGYLMAGLLTGEDLETALRQASSAGALAVTKPGAASSIPSRVDVLSFTERTG